MEQTPKADSFVFISGLFAFVSIAEVQAYVSLTAGIVAIVSGLCAIRYYLIKSKNKNDV